MLKRIRPIAPRPPQFGRGVSRRSCLLGWLLGATGLTADGPRSVGPRWADGDATEAKVIAQVQDAAKKAGLPPFKTSGTEHFLGLGDGPDLYRESALKICEEFSKAFLTYFQSQGYQARTSQGSTDGHHTQGRQLVSEITSARILATMSAVITTSKQTSSSFSTFVTRKKTSQAIPSASISSA